MAVVIDVPSDYSANLRDLTESPSQENSTPLCNCNYELDPTLISSLQDLLTLYRLKMRSSESKQTVSSGGVQQLINNRRRVPHRSLMREDSAPVLLLPENVQLHIMSFLSTEDLCRVSGVCALWNDLASDNLLWKQKLTSDMHRWESIGHATNPDIYEECQSDWPYKQIYLRCSPEVNKKMRNENNNFHTLSAMLRSIWPKKSPKLAMMGPGLESSTSGIVRTILEDETKTFITTGMFPGQFEGVGSGFNMKIEGSLSFDLVTLYSNTRAARQNYQANERLLYHRLMEHNPENEGIEITRPMKDLCRTLNGVIFVVDASQASDIFEHAQLELHAMMSDMWMSTNNPLLVLSCVTNSHCHKSCMEISRLLQLGKLNRPWQVRNCSLQDIKTIVGGFEWIIELSQR